MKSATKKILGTLAAFAALSAAGLAQAGIYKWVDERGITNYTQYKPPVADEVEVIVPPPTPEQDPNGANQRLEAQLKHLDDTRKEREQRAGDKAKQEGEKAAREDNCQKSRDNLAKLTTGGRKRMIGEDGVARYLSEEERQELIDKMQKRIEEYCD